MFANLESKVFLTDNGNEQHERVIVKDTLSTPEKSRVVFCQVRMSSVTPWNATRFSICDLRRKHFKKLIDMSVKGHRPNIWPTTTDNANSYLNL